MVVSVFGLADASSAQPQAGGAEALAAARAEALANPASPDAAVRYARLAADQGDATSAIVALERVLRLDPTLDNIRLELASLHLAAGQPDLAAAYARQALESPRIPPEVAGRARTLLRNAERGAQRSTFDVNLFAGLRYDSNANQATSLATVPIFAPALGGFVEAPLSNRGRSDWSLVLGARAQHRVDLELQREGSWETNAAAFNQRFARIPRAFDLGILSLDTGPRIGVAEFGDDARLSLRPFATLGWLGYADSTYGWLYGGGATAELRLGARWTAELTGLGRFGNYENSAARATAREFTGFESSVIGALTYALDDATRLSAAVSWTDADARVGWNARQGPGLVLGANTVFAPAPEWQLGVAARAGVRQARFDAPDPFLDPTRRREDTRWEAGLSLVLPLTERLAVVGEYDWFRQRSTYEIYRYTNHAVTLGIRINL